LHIERTHITLRIPDGLAKSCAGDAARTAWAGALPTVVAELARRWSLTIGPPFVDSEGSCAWVAPATLADGTDAVLKVALPHMEGADEIAGLRFWDGEVTVRLLDADEAHGAMLLERCRPGTSLRALPEAEQDAVLGELLPRLWRPPTAERGFRPLSDMLAYWTDETRAVLDRLPYPALVRAGLELFAELPATAETTVVLFTDLHAGNVLRAQRATWLAIDPKPFVGDPAFDATQHLFNCLDRMKTEPLATIASFAGRLGLMPERVRLWMFARCAAELRGHEGFNPWTDVARRIAP
jgi:streptomycin 6-kinase